MAPFSALNLNASLLRSIETEGFESPTEVQAQTIPALMDGKDLMGVAQTGGGKTAAFTLPLLHRLAEDRQRPNRNAPRAVILAPTRELAIQIGECIRTFSKGLRIYHTVVYGGAPFRPQFNALNRGVDILVATPGRLLDHVRRNSVRFDETTTFILDEADRMLDMGFVDDVMEVAKALPEDHQTVLFSATMGKNVRKLADKLLNDPVHVEVARESTVANTIDHKVMFVSRHNKRPLLHKILQDNEVDCGLVFTRTKADADRVADELEEIGIKAGAIHGDKPQHTRQRTLQAFRKGKFSILVATDVAARGIDVPGITHVVNYDIPLDPESYVHRVGRTGRAGAEGNAISFCDNTEKGLLRNVERIIKQRIEIDGDHPYVLAPRANDGKRKPGGKNFRKFPGKGGFGKKSGGGERREEGGFRADKSGKPFRKPRSGANDGGDKPYFKKRRDFKQAS
ncbi:DEAD/DEAH box helicase [Aestuariispira insulae]|uniref:DEAD-box ATP-dependent RNA helicase RhpA n=1 Tax=Aestuariispira insulae TaxID=1461337 RepID=A0A3D9H5N4_9PROT|nr:DEAD/DEAH box helicase [Aestuariispira insulae]RED44810.1 ATP-dependent RNA helicase RhlE [Aestuariispira insulae]